MLEFVKNRDHYPNELEASQVANILNCSPQSVYHLLRNRKVSHYRIGKKYYIETDDLLRYISQQRVSSEEDYRRLSDVK